MLRDAVRLPVMFAMQPPLILLVDNDADNGQMYAEYLRSRGWRVATCADSQWALDVARRRKPDIIVVELRMNGMNGLELLARLKADPLFAAVPVVALTASVLSWEWAAANASDFAQVLSKPCLPDHVADVITRIVSSSAIAAPPPPAVLHTAVLTAD